MRSALSLLLFFFLTFLGTLVSPELVLESGYSVSTVLDFNKPLPLGGLGTAVRPFSLFPLTRSSNNLILLDSTHSAFYSLELPLSQASVVRLLSGKGTAGFSDGDTTSAMFDRPRSFAVDSNDNVYVADRINHAIRKISSSSGMTSTIAGGYSRKAGHIDGPAQNATFSEDFDLLYMPKMCTLLISDRGSGMIRQMDLQPEDCEVKTRQSTGLGAISVSIIAVVALLCGLAFGFIVRPFMTLNSSGVSMNHWILHFRKHFQSTRRKLPLIFSSGIRSAAASLKALHLLFLRLVNSCIGYSCVVFRNVGLEKLVHGKEHVLLLHGDFISSPKLQQIRDESKDFIDFEVESVVFDSSSSTNQPVKMEDSPSATNLQGAEEGGDLNGKIDNMMISNLLDFTTQSKQQCVVKRRKGVHDQSH